MISNVKYIETITFTDIYRKQVTSSEDEDFTIKLV